MRIHFGVRKRIALLLLAGILVLSLPSIPLAGGCDEPGYTGGSCGSKKDSWTPGPPGPPPHKGPGRKGTITFGAAELRSWFVTILTGLVR